MGAIGHRLMPPRVAMKSLVVTAVTGREGLEIGGPSRVFAGRNILPVYPAAGRIDNVNFSTHIAGESNLRDGGEFHFASQRSPGRQWIRDAVSLTGVADGAYDSSDARLTQTTGKPSRPQALRPLA
jgi:hypothetical protein